MPTTDEDTLPTIWEVPDALWERFLVPLLAQFDPLPRWADREPIPRKCLDGNPLPCPNRLPVEPTAGEVRQRCHVHRTLKRWEDKGIFDKLWALLIYHCEELSAVHWEWQAADGCLNKARFIGKKGAKAHRTQKNRHHAGQGIGPNPRTVEKWVSSRACLSRETADHFLSASRQPT
jgi:hypothetical protein